MLGSTGYGISAGIQDNEHPVIVLDCKKQEVRFESEDGKQVLALYSFDKYVQSNVGWPEA